MVGSQPCVAGDAGACAADEPLVACSCRRLPAFTLLRALMSPTLLPPLPAERGQRRGHRCVAPGELLQLWACCTLCCAALRRAGTARSCGAAARALLHAPARARSVPAASLRLRCMHTLLSAGAPPRVSSSLREAAWGASPTTLDMPASQGLSCTSAHLLCALSPLPRATWGASSTTRASPTARPKSGWCTASWPSGSSRWSTSPKVRTHVGLQRPTLGGNACVSPCVWGACNRLRRAVQAPH